MIRLLLLSIILCSCSITGQDYTEPERVYRQGETVCIDIGDDSIAAVLQEDVTDDMLVAVVIINGIERLADTGAMMGQYLCEVKR
jgi:hypothetical protein